MLSLERYKVLDLSRMLPGPFCGHILADLGMQVTRVEEVEPRYGMGRDALTPGELSPQEEERYTAFNILGRNKRSIALNLLEPSFRPQSQEIFYTLAKQADVILEGYRPGAVTWMGVDYPTIKKHNPKIIYCSITGYGQDGPYSKYPGHGTQFDGLGGSILLDDAGAPITHPVPLGDVSAALYATTCIVGALLEREITGEGQHLDVPLAATAMSLMSQASSRYARTGGEDRQATRGPGPLTFLKCGDGKWLSTSNSETIFWQNFCKVLSHQEWVPLYRQHGPVADAMFKEVEDLFLTKPCAEWLKILANAETCVAPINDIGEAMQDPQMRHVGMVWDVHHTAVGNFQQLGFPVRFSGKQVKPGTPAPMLGQHTREVLAEAGYTTAQIDELEKKRIVKTWQNGVAGG